MKFSFAKYSVPAIFAAMQLVGCSSDGLVDEPLAEPVQPQTQTETVGLRIELGSQWDIDVDPSRAAPPGLGAGSNNQSDINSNNGDAEIQGVDRVRVISFRRNDEGEFFYDPSNDRDLPLTQGPTDDLHTAHPHLVAADSLIKTYGYEYRVVAIAYDSKKASGFPAVGATFALPSVVGDQNRFDLGITDGLKFSEFRARILAHEIKNHDNNWQDYIGGYTNSLLHYVTPIFTGNLSMKAAEVPQLFYAECSTVAGNVIGFLERTPDGFESTKLDITGTLYRGMAKVELHIRQVDPFTYLSANYNPQWIALMADNVMTEANLNSYDGFLTPKATIAADKFTAIAYAPVAATGETVLTAYLLPCKTRLALRIKGLGLADSYRMTNAQLFPSDRESTGNGTGIISPDSHDGYFYLRRNHKYVITLNSTANIVTNHSLNQ